MAGTYDTLGSEEEFKRGFGRGNLKIKVKVKVSFIYKGHEDPEEKYSCNCTLSLTSKLEGGG